MGCPLSKPPADPPADDPHYASDLHSYSSACRRDPDVQSFDANLQRRMTRALSSLAGGVAVRSLSFDSLKEVTSCLLDMNQEVVKVILECKADIWKTPELFRLVEDYFDNSLQTLDFCAALERRLARARDAHLVLHLALQSFDEMHDQAKTLEYLGQFRDAGNPFDGEFFGEFRAVYEQQTAMLERLRARKRRLDKKLGSLKAWRKVSCVIFAAVFASVIICSVVAAAVAAPPVAAAVAAASSVPVGSMGKWFDSLMRRFEDVVGGQREVVGCMEVGSFVAVKDLDGIRVLVDGLESRIGCLAKVAEFAGEEEENVRVGVEEIRRKVGELMKSIEDLSEQADRCSRDIRKARTVVLQRIIRYPKQND